MCRQDTIVSSFATWMHLTPQVTDWFLCQLYMRLVSLPRISNLIPVKWPVLCDVASHPHHTLMNCRYNLLSEKMFGERVFFQDKPIDALCGVGFLNNPHQLESTWARRCLNTSYRYIEENAPRLQLHAGTGDRCHWCATEQSSVQWDWQGLICKKEKNVQVWL